ncbi:MAG TPA: alginate lyase family protein, partial [Polyangiaceae bacterium]|nr:alginate lyase family protein [Polyangiaceae bacterium]
MTWSLDRTVARGRWVFCLAVFCLLGCKSRNVPPTAKSDPAKPARALADFVDGRRLPVLNASPEPLFQRMQAFHKTLPAPILFDGYAEGKNISAQDLKRDGVSLKDKQFSVMPPIEWGTVGGSDKNRSYLINAWRPLKDIIVSYRASSDPELMRVARNMALDWVDYNIRRDRPNAHKWHDMATGLRAEKLSFVIDDGLRSGQLTEQELTTLLDAAERHGQFLSNPKNLADGNHALFMLAGLSTLCRNVPELRNCDQYLKFVDQQLPKLLASQFSPSGVHLEGAPGYHQMMVGVLTNMQKFKVFGDNTGFAELIAKAKAILPAFYHPTGEMVLIGDSEAKQMATRPELAFVTNEGNEGEAPADPLPALTESGFFVYRSPWQQKPFTQHTFLFFSSGTFDSPHSHADDFTFEWSEFGQPILVDSGKYTYNTNDLRKFFHSTRAGNTIEVDGKDNPPRPFGSRLKGWSVTGPLYFATASVQRAGSNVLHARALIGKPREWLCVVDFLSSKTAHKYRQWFGAHEALEVANEDGHFTLTGQASFKVDVRSLGEKEMKTELRKGETGKRLQGWISRKYGSKVPRYSFAFTQKGEDARFVTLFSLDGSPKSDEVTMSGDTL